MFTKAQDRAYSHPEPRAEDRMNELASDRLVQSLAGLKVWFTTRGLEAEFLGALEGVYEAIGEYPLPEPTNWMTVEHAALSRMYKSARAAWQAKREQAA